MNKFKAILAIAIAAALSGCGYTSRDNEVVGQVKRVMQKTPMVCPNYYTADISMGVLRNGVGNVSKEDIWVVIPEDKVAQFKKLAETGQPIKATYDVTRWAWCSPADRLRTVDTLQ
jgi:hypothetical protein